MSVVRASLAGNPGALPSPEKIELGLAEVQFPAVLSVFLVNIPSRSQFLPHPSSHSRYFYATSDNLRDPYFEKVGIRTPRFPVAPPVNPISLDASRTRRTIAARTVLEWFVNAVGKMTLSSETSSSSSSTKSFTSTEDICLRQITIKPSTMVIR